MDEVNQRDRTMIGGHRGSSNGYRRAATRCLACDATTDGAITDGASACRRRAGSRIPQSVRYSVRLLKKTGLRIAA
jgi:hypothetical protein